MTLYQFRVLHYGLDKHEEGYYNKWTPYGQSVRKAHSNWKKWIRYVVSQGYIPSDIIRQRRNG